jgi:hypothetical protein
LGRQLYKCCRLLCPQQAQKPQHQELLLLLLDSGAAGSETPVAAPSKAAAELAVALGHQQLEVEHLPSLVIFVRCCLLWARQLQQQPPDHLLVLLLLLLASGAAVQQRQPRQQQQQGEVQAEHSAARECVGGWQEGDAPATASSGGLDGR